MKDVKLMHYVLEPTNEMTEQVRGYSKYICSQAIDMADDAVVSTCISVAIEAGITDLYLLDKEFVANALKRALLLEKRGRCPYCGSRMDGEVENEKV